MRKVKAFPNVGVNVPKTKRAIPEIEIFCIGGDKFILIRQFVRQSRQRTTRDPAFEFQSLFIYRGKRVPCFPHFILITECVNPLYILTGYLALSGHEPLHIVPVEHQLISRTDTHGIVETSRAGEVICDSELPQILMRSN